MKYYVVSDSRDGKEDIQGLYYLISDRGQYIDNTLARSMQLAYDYFMKKDRPLLLEKYGEPITFHLLKDTDMSIWQLKVLNRTLEKRQYDKNGKVIKLREPEPIIIEGKKPPKEMTNEELLVKRERKRIYNKNYFRYFNYKRYFEDKGEK